MRELNLKLTEIFKTNSLKPYTTPKHCATPAKGSLCYVWNDAKTKGIKERLDKGEIFRPGGDCVNNLIELNESVYKECCKTTIIVGPNTTTKTQTIQILELEDSIRILFSGWGSSSILLWEGRPSDFFRYLNDHQKGDA